MDTTWREFDFHYDSLDKGTDGNGIPWYKRNASNVSLRQNRVTGTVKNGNTTRISTADLAAGSAKNTSKLYTGDGKDTIEGGGG